MFVSTMSVSEHRGTTLCSKKDLLLTVFQEKLGKEVRIGCVSIDLAGRYLLLRF